MEPNKFEKHIKDRMQDREIQPSKNAWEKISERLETPQKRDKKYMWYAMAASFVGVLIISALFFRSNEAIDIPDVEIVDSNEKELREERDDSKGEGQMLTIEKETLKKGNVVASTNKKSVHRENPNKESEVIQDIKSINVAMGNDEVKKVELDEFLNDTDQSIDLKIKEVLQQVNVLEQDKEALTEAEVDSLLYEAQRQILTESIFNSESSIDAMALLNEVEGELDESFRDQIFEKLKSGFLKVRTAVADRNN